MFIYLYLFIYLSILFYLSFLLTYCSYGQTYCSYGQTRYCTLGWQGRGLPIAVISARMRNSIRTQYLEATGRSVPHWVKKINSEPCDPMSHLGFGVRYEMRHLPRKTCFFPCKLFFGGFVFCPGSICQKNLSQLSSGVRNFTAQCDLSSQCDPSNLP
jgi:hypothetical protein